MRGKGDGMALVPMKTSTGTGYCDCIHGCYELAAVRDEETGKGYCPACAKDHLDMNKGIGLPQLPSSKIAVNESSTIKLELPETADPPGRLR
jgi:hypothetical protein